MRKRTLSICLLLLAALCLSGCLGPKPVIENYKSTPPVAGSDQPFKVDALLSNKGPGEGQVEVTVDLKDKQSNIVLVADSKDVDLKKDDEIHVLFNLDLPPSAQNIDPNNIDVEVDAHYPIE